MGLCTGEECVRGQKNRGTFMEFLKVVVYHWSMGEGELSLITE